MDAVPDFPAFQPLGLSSWVGPGAHARTRSRADLCRGDDGCEGSDIVFALHTVDVKDGAPVYFPLANACDELALRAAISDATAPVDAEDWEAAASATATVFEDAAAVTCVAYLTGQTASGWKVGFVVPFSPFFEVEMTDNTPAARQAFRRFLPVLARSLGVGLECIGEEWHTGCRFKGYVPDPANPLQRKTFLYARLSFPSIKLMETAAHRLRGGLFTPGTPFGSNARTYFTVYEDRIDADQKFVDRYNLQPSGWHRVAKADAARARDDRRALLVNAEYSVRTASAIQLVAGDAKTVPPMVIASVDAEMNGKVANRFPKAFRPDNAVVVVGVTFALAGQSDRKCEPRGSDDDDDDEASDSASNVEGVEFERQAFVLGRACAPIAGVIVRLYDSEFELIAAVRDELFVHKHVDIVAGHNLVKFDMAYLYERMAGPRVRVPVPTLRFLRFGALLSESLQLKSKQLSSAGMGSNTLSLLCGVGFAYVDTMLLCKQNHKLRENTLVAAAAAFLPGDAGKFEMPYSLIPVVAEGTDPEHWRLLTAYCVQDCLLVLQLLKKWDSVKDLVAQSRVINIPMAVNVLCGQQQRVRDSLMKKARTMHMVMNGVNEKRKALATNVTAEGGWVLDNVPGLHDKPVVVLDFASLYPSVQREHNLCWSTVVETPADITPAHRAAGLEVQEYVTATGTYHIVKNVPGVFPLQLKDLLDARKAYKKEMADAPYGSSAYQNGDAKQKATKIVMNSGYGTANCEEGKGIMPCKAVGTITCAEGRKLNQLADAACKARFGTTTLYGDTDSIMVYFPEEELYARVAREHGGRAPTRKERLQHAWHMGEAAEQYLNDVVFRSEVIKTECEKVYFPFLSSGKKTYAGLKFEAKDVAGATDDLDRPDKSKQQTGGSIEAKGIRTVRRDVPLFCRKMTQGLLDALFFERDLDAFWGIVHDYTERVCHGGIALEEFGITKEIKDGYETQVVVPPHVAVSYAREYACPGSGYSEGDRVCFYFVYQYDAGRVVRPASLGAGTTAKTGHIRSVEEEDAAAEAGAAAFKKQTKECLDPKRAMYARHIDEIRKNPEENQIDIEYYVEGGIVSVLKQLVPDEVAAHKEVLAYAARAKQYYRGLQAKKTCALKSFKVASEEAADEAADGAGEIVTTALASLRKTEALANLVPLSHARPKKTNVATFYSLCDTGSATCTAPSAKKKAAPKKKAAAALQFVPF